MAGSCRRGGLSCTSTACEERGGVVRCLRGSCCCCSQVLQALVLLLLVVLLGTNSWCLWLVVVEKTCSLLLLRWACTSLGMASAHSMCMCQHSAWPAVSNGLTPLGCVCLFLLQAVGGGGGPCQRHPHLPDLHQPAPGGAGGAPSGGEAATTASIPAPSSAERSFIADVGPEPQEHPFWPFL